MTRPLTPAHIDPLTGCVRRDIQCEWRASVVCSDGSIRSTRTFYLPPECGEAEARARAVEIWSDARNWPRAVRVEKLRGPLVAWPGVERREAA